MNNAKKAICNGMIFTGKGFCKGTILIKKNKINSVIFENIPSETWQKAGYSIIDANSCIVSYGFFDPHVHFRCPGAAHKEDWQTGSKAALAGGFTFIGDMPNNSPAATNFDILKLKSTLPKSYPINYGLYVGLTDENAKDIKKIINKARRHGINILGIKCFIGSSTGNLLIKDDNSIYEALKTGEQVLFHCEDQRTLDKTAHIPYQTVLDHNNIRPVSAEIEGLHRIIRAAAPIKDKAKIYICHISAKDTMRQIKKYREQGYTITTEVSPHHLFFSMSNIIADNIYKVNPPIRTETDVTYLRNKFNKGKFKIIGSDHAPHLLAEKQSDNPPSGFPGLETSFYALHNLVERNILDIKRVLKCLTSGYKIFGIKKRGKIKKGNYADITIIKPQPHVVKAAETYTKADFTPYENLKTNMSIDTVILNGEIVYKGGKFEE